MRITNNIIRENALLHMRRGYQQMEEAQERVSTGLRLRHASDDPGAAGTAMTTRSSIRALDQYRRAIDIARARSTEEESALDSLEGVLVRARELAIAFVGDSSASQARGAASAEAQQLFHSAVGVANTRLADTFLFGGNTASDKPYEVTGTAGTLDFTTTSPAGVHEVEVADQQRIVTTDSGTAVFEDTDALAALRDFANAITNGDTEGIKQATDRLRLSHEAVLDVHVSLGTRVNSLDVTQTNLSALEINLQTLKSSIEEVDIEKAVTDLVGRQTAYQAAMLATSRVMGLTLTDYLR